MPALRLHEDEEEQDLGSAHWESGYRWTIAVGSPDPPKWPTKCPNFSHTCYKVASSAHHSVPAALHSGIHCLGKGSFLVPRFAAGRQSLQAGKPRQCQSLEAGMMALSKSHRPNLPAGRFYTPELQVRAQGRSLHRRFPGVWQQGCLSRLRWLKAELARECRRKGRTSCHCL